MPDRDDKMKSIKHYYSIFLKYMGETSEDLSPDPHLKFSSGIHFLGENDKKIEKISNAPRKL